MKLTTIDGKPVPHFFLKKGERLLYKLTTQKNTTRGDTLWEIGKTVYAANQHPSYVETCSPDVVHAYEHPFIALVRNNQDADIQNPNLWLAKGTIVGKNNGLKVGCKSLTTLVQLAIPEISSEQMIAFGIYSSLVAYKEKLFITWAYNWLANKDRTRAAARAASFAASFAAAKAATNAVAYAEYAAASAASAAYAATNAVAYAAYATYAAAYAATYAAAYAANAKTKLNIIQIAEKAMRIK